MKPALRVSLIGCLLILFVNAAFASPHKHPRKRVTASNWIHAIRQVLAEYAPITHDELRPYFESAKIHFPPKHLALLAFKEERRIELWANDDKHDWRIIKHYPLTAFSGRLGPKLRYHDDQIPEGIYRITALNPYSSWHLSMRVNYPNAFDRRHARVEHRTNLGGDIFIHGNQLSVGCLAVGDDAIDQLFVLVGEVGTENTQLIIAPNDLRRDKPHTQGKKLPQWLPELYQQIALGLAPFHTTG